MSFSDGGRADSDGLSKTSGTSILFSRVAL